jgi:hypothetical protein
MRQELTVATVMERESNVTQRRAFLTIILLVVAGLMIASCTRRLVGSPIEEDHLLKIAIRETTRADIFRLFGTPYRIEVKDGQEILTYLYGREENWSVLVYSEIRERADILTIYIDRNGLVSDYAFAKGIATPEMYLRNRPVVISPQY